MHKMKHLKKAFMLVNQHGDLVMAAPSTTRRGAWANVRERFGAVATLHYKKHGYRPEEVSFSVPENVEWRWNMKQESKNGVDA